MQPATDVPWDQITGFLTGEATGPEREALDRWIAECPEHGTIMAAAQHVWGADYDISHPDISSLKAQVSARIGMAVDADATALAARRAVRLRQRQWGGRALSPVWYGMTVCALAICAVVLVRSGWTRRWTEGRSVAMSTYTTANGERATITLPDGNVVTLNVASQLQVPADYMAGNHALRLNGEALFNAVHHSGKPLTVAAGSIEARVLGTSFVVRHYAADSLVTVAVLDGKVAVGKSVVTTAEMVEVSSAGIARPTAADPSLFSFASGVMKLKRQHLAAAISELNRWYNADLRLGDSVVGDRVIEGEFFAGSLGDLQSYLEWTLNVRVVRDGQMLTIYSR